jgi:hypothetical protein
MILARSVEHGKERTKTDLADVRLASGAAAANEEQKNRQALPPRLPGARASLTTSALACAMTTSRAVRCAYLFPRVQSCHLFKVREEDAGK